MLVIQMMRMEPVSKFSINISYNLHGDHSSAFSKASASLTLFNILFN
ncbi:hypothetical protein SLEP1_g29626 [Rubroshorea leprosula]|uniref:Uncharacterized protein n=1 Tax=Rubroshorea leprosula TaxID=152421 RepID=A0AAV5K822_9ROSI|nr:hypothetical protein SLEP1_g29626 [Rubroshorea leprosula]